MKKFLSLVPALAVLIVTALFAPMAKACGPVGAGYCGHVGFAGSYGYNTQTVVAVPFVQTFAVQQYVAAPPLVAVPAPTVQYASPAPVAVPAVPVQAAAPPVAVQYASAPPVAVAAVPIVAVTAPVLQEVFAVSSYNVPQSFVLGVNNFVEHVGFHHFYH